jgi:hypothetical protein
MLSREFQLNAFRTILRKAKKASRISGQYPYDTRQDMRGRMENYKPLRCGNASLYYLLTLIVKK